MMGVKESVKSVVERAVWRSGGDRMNEIVLDMNYKRARSQSMHILVYVNLSILQLRAVNEIPPQHRQHPSQRIQICLCICNT